MALKKWRALAKAEESFLRQKSRIKCLKLGNMNNGFSTDVQQLGGPETDSLDFNWRMDLEVQT